MKKSIYYLGIAAVMFLAACSDDDADEVVDTTPPSIDIHEPTAGESVAAGSMMHFEATFTDNEALATYNVDLHNNFDGHSHGKVSVEPFDFEESFTLSGKTAEPHEDIDIAANATAGPYHLTVVAIDASGNSTTFADGSSVEMEVWITNEEMAIVHFHDAAGAEIDEFEGEVGVALSFFGEIEDQSGALDHVDIAVGHLEVGEEHDHDHGGKIGEEPIYEKEFEVEGQTTVMIETLLAGESIIIPQEEVDELEEGEHLYLIVTAKDEDGNISRSALEIHFD